MDSTGLPQKQRSESEFSKITGWIILKNYIINGSLKDKLKDTNCYIFSGYGNIFSETNTAGAPYAHELYYCALAVHAFFWFNLI